MLCGALTLDTCTVDAMLFAYSPRQLVHLILTQYPVGVLPSRPGISLGGAPATDTDTPITLDLVSTLTRKLSLRSSQKELEQKHIVLTESEEVRGKRLAVYPYVRLSVQVSAALYTAPLPLARCRDTALYATCAFCDTMVLRPPPQ